jgi:hypothetical protein
MDETTRQFTDLVSGRACTLVIPPPGSLSPKHGMPKAGIRHPDCDQLAGISAGLDAFYCPACRYSGRVSGAWCLDMIKAATA